MNVMSNLQNKLLYILLVIFSMSGWSAYIYTAQQKATQHYDVLSGNMTVRYVRSIVWYHSRGKLVELKALLNDKTLSNVELKLKIENMLRHRTSVYIEEFNHVNSPVPQLGNWYAEHFNFNDFLKDIGKEVVKHNITVEIRVDRCTDIMERYQNNTTLLLKKYLHKNGGLI